MINKCYREKEVFDEINKADLVIDYKKGATHTNQKSTDQLPYSISFIKSQQQIIQVRLCTGLDKHVDTQQYGFRKAKSTSQPISIYCRISEIHEEAGLEMYTLHLDWETTFDKVDQEVMMIVFKRI